MKVARLGLLLICAALVPWAVRAESAARSAAGIAARMPQIDVFVQAEMQREKIPGLAVAIVSQGTVAAAKGYGKANLELDVPVTQDTLFQSGSLGKAFTAVAVMLQVEAGRLGLDEPVTRYFPDAPRSWQGITVRNLLTHTSGIPDFTEDQKPHGPPPQIDLRRDYTEDDLTKAAYKLALAFPSGSKWDYSNTGYELLGFIVRKTSGRFYGDVLHDQVFVPLRMGTARIMNEADIIANRAAGYRLVNGEIKNQEYVSPSLNTTADGSLYLSIRDWIAWDRGLRAHAVLKPASWAEIYTPVTLRDGTTFPYGFGWFIGEAKQQPLYHHSGSWQGFNTYIARYLADDLTVIALSNQGNSSAKNFVEGIVKIIDPELLQGRRYQDD
jgi:CubicO group peptidase (beta-lactamase class C family)